MYRGRCGDSCAAMAHCCGACRDSGKAILRLIQALEVIGCYFALYYVREQHDHL